MAEDFEKPWRGTETAGSTALSFVNTLDWRLRETPVELLHGYEDLLRWAWTEGALPREEARDLRAWGRAHPRVAARLLQEAKALREALATLFLAVAAGERLPARELERLDAACRAARGAQTLRAAGGAAAWEWREAPAGPERPIHAAALGASALLTSPDLDKVRLCGDDECGWLFLDTSRNRSRRWCSMEACGNRNKARRFYRRSVSGR
jgi:predicted RNA-binding Zn ribbon-like protein